MSSKGSQNDKNKHWTFTQQTTMWQRQIPLKSGETIKLGFWGQEWEDREMAKGYKGWDGKKKSQKEKR